MENVGESIGWGLVVAASLLAGALTAVVLKLPSRLSAIVTAFGGGTLLAAVALELVPEADREAGVALTAAGMLAGTLVYVFADTRLNRDPEMKMMREAGHAAAAGRAMEMPAGDSGEPEALGSAECAGGKETKRGESIAVGIFVDGVPESIALGLTIAEGEVGIALLAGILIGNVVESYGAAQPIIAGGRSKRFAILLLGAIGFALAFATVLGGTLLADASPDFVGTAQAVAAGAVLAVVSIAVIPHAFEEVSSAVATATVAGFIVGYLLS